MHVCSQTTVPRLQRAPIAYDGSSLLVSVPQQGKRKRDCKLSIQQFTVSISDITLTCGTTSLEDWGQSGVQDGVHRVTQYVTVALAAGASSQQTEMTAVFPDLHPQTRVPRLSRPLSRA
jgi:hypothetical protein